MAGKPHNIVVCCDGTWCGVETGTRGNIQILADAFASAGVSPEVPVWVKDGEPYKNPATNTDVCYFNGCGTSGLEKKDEPPGLLGGFFDLLVYTANGALASDLPDRCKEAYSFIVDKYTPGSRIWLFGLSRGAYTVRAVAGMINNCGIIKPGGGVPSDDPKAAQAVLVEQVWRMYIDDSDDLRPHGQDSERFKSDTDKVWPKGDKPPIMFMGLLDTVGAFGLPRIDVLAPKPLTYQYRPFRDFVVSSEVQHVFQACSTHDRLMPFEACPVRRQKDYVGAPQPASGTSVSGDDTIPGRDQPVGADHAYNVEYTMEEWWYPGAHYDVGRQDFVFGNQKGINTFNRVLNQFRTNVACLPELADYPLIGYELKGNQTDPPATDLAAYPPCIVGRVCALTKSDISLLPHPSNTEIWDTLVKGPQPALDIVPSHGLVRNVIGISTDLLTWAYEKTPGPQVVGKVLEYFGGKLPWQLFQPAYTVDAETKILGQLAQVVSFVLTGKMTTRVLLQDRVIPTPGRDPSTGCFNKPAKFFPVPRDSAKYESYKAFGRGKDWFMSETYDVYQNATSGAAAVTGTAASTAAASTAAAATSAAVQPATKGKAPASTLRASNGVAVV